MSTDVVEVESNAVATHDIALAADSVLARMREVDHIKKNVMKKGVDYGKIPGCAKDSLWQSGAEKLLMAFVLSVEVAEVEDVSSGGEIRYRVKTNIIHRPSQQIIAQGVGECSSSEDKYMWREQVCQNEFEATPEDKRRVKWFRGNPPYSKQQVRTDPASISNTILTMAKKRSLINGTRTATAASSVFTDGIEDLQGVIDIESADAEGGPPTIRPPQEKPKAKVQPAPTAGGAAISDAQRKRMFAILFNGASGDDDRNTRATALKEHLSAIGIADSKAIPKSQYEGIVEYAEEIAKGGDNA